MERDDGLIKLISVAGGITAIADLLKITTASVAGWKSVPARRVLALEAALNKRIRRWEMRPDLYPPPQRRAA